MRRRLDDRSGPAFRILGLEDPRSDEHAFGTKLHDQRGVGRRRDPAGAEQHDGQAPVGGDLPDEVQRGLKLLGRGGELGVVERRQTPDLARGSCADG